MRSLLLSGCLIGAFALGLAAHQRILHPTTEAPLFWQNPGTVGIVISSAGSDDIGDGSHETALRSAIRSWNQAPGSIARLDEDASEAAQAQTDWESDALHLIWFDEDNSSGYFPPGSSTVAITPIWFFSNGMISDADVIFNGSGFDFTTSGESGAFDVEDVGAHELGHLLGLDHSPFAGSTMYPYVDSTVILHRSLSLDDVGGVRAAYPDATFGRITGVVERADASPVVRAHVVAVDADGRTSAAILSDETGAFELLGLDPGTYTVYAGPLDGPVTAGNFSGAPQVDTDFQVASFAATATVPAAGQVDLGALTVGDDTTLSLGRSTDRLPLRAIRGQTTLHSLRGSGLAVGSTLETSDPLVTVNVLSWLGTFVQFEVTTPADAGLGHVDLLVTSAAGDQAVLPAALELTPPDPVVQQVDPTGGSLNGGTSLTITGTGFLPGARVVIGDRIYADGEPGGCTVTGETSITLTTAATVSGLHDVVVVDASGVEGRLADGFQVSLQPVLTSTFPAAGDAAGGTEVRLAGADFAPDVTVRIDGVEQSQLTWVSAEELRFVTTGAALAGVYTLEVEDAGGAVAQSTFVYTASPDPLVQEVSPDQGDPAGGETITVRGQNFPSDAEVVFGADPADGSGGTASPSVVFVDDETLLVETPPGAGLQAVLVRAAGTGQADVLESGFLYGSEGGGGCSTGPVPRTPADKLAASSWLLALFALAALRWLVAASRAQPALRVHV